MASSSRIPRIPRPGSVAPLVVFGMVAAALLGVTIYYVSSGNGGETSFDPILAAVERGEFVSQVLDQGEVQSSENVEIRCEVRARNGSLSVIEVTPEGSRVSGGDFLVRLDSTAFEKELETQKISVANSETSVIQADATLTTARESLKEYEQGIFVEKKKEIENNIYDAQSQIETANQELTQARAVLAHSKKLQAKGFITKQQLESERFNVNRAEFALKRAKNLLELSKKQEEVLVNITRVKETEQFKADIKAAEVQLANAKEALQVEKGQLEEIKTQIDKCEIRVPEGVQGQVVYAKESSRGGNDWVLEEGTTVRERQVLVRLPNPDKMEVKALINEQSITQIKEGMPASIRVDALANVSLKGVVTKVNQYAEQSGWMSSTIRKYAVFVRILDPPETLKPGMNAAVTIEVRYEKDALKAPIQTIYAVQDRQFCLVKTGDGQWATREVNIDGDNSQVVLITDGLEEGDQVVMNPGAYKEMMELPEFELEQKIEIPEEAKKTAMKENEENQIGKTSNQSAEKSQGRQGRGEGGPRGQRGGGSGRGGMGGFDPAAIVDRMFQRYDKNSDGKVDKDELADLDERAKGRVEQADTNSDGEITKEEMTSAMKKMMERFNSGGGGGGFGPPRGGGR